MRYPISPVAKVAHRSPDEPRFWILEAANDANRIAAIASAADCPMFGIVDDDEGGVIAYASPLAADRIVDALNRQPDNR